MADLGTFLPLVGGSTELALNVAVGHAAGFAVEIARGAVAKVFGRARPQ